MQARVWTIVGVGLAAVLQSGCDGRTKMNVAKTHGQVLCEGEPVQYATVYFEPLQTGKNANVGKQGIAYADRQGNFVVTTYDTDDGAVVGKHRVRVGRPLGELKSDVKCECVLSEEVDVTQVEVEAGKDNTFEIVLKKPASADVKAKIESRAAKDAEIDD